MFKWLFEAFFLQRCFAAFVSSLQQTTKQRGGAFQKNEDIFTEKET
jgi:hypothetical protein